MYSPQGEGLGALVIDSKKDWNAKGITNLKELASDMHKGDILMQQGGVLVKLSPGDIGDLLTAHGLGMPLTFEPPPGSTVPTVVTDDATDVMATSAVLNGRVISTGRDTPDHIYFDWDSDSGVPYAHTEDLGPGGVGAYSVLVTGLTEGTPYYFRIRAHNIKGDNWGIEKSFTTEAILAPDMITHDAEDITSTSARLVGEVVDTHWENPTRYFDWGYYIPSGWLTGFTYRKEMTVVGSTAGAQTDYQMKLTIHKGGGSDSGADVYLNGHCQDDFRDIRFTNSTGTELDYWIESYTVGDSAVVWVELDGIPASPDTASFYIYYDNVSASSSSNGNNTFSFFDDFEDGDYTNNPIWTVLSGTYSASNHYLDEQSTEGRIYTSQGNAHGRWHAKLKHKHNLVNSILRWYILYSGNPDPDNDAAKGYYLFINASGSFYFRLCRDDGSTNVVIIDATPGISDTNWHIIEVTRSQSNKFTIYLDGTVEGNVTDATYTSSQYMGLRDGVNANPTVCLDDIFVANYCDPEPTFGDWGDEEMAYIIYEEDCGVGGVGIYDKVISGLTPDTQYYFRAKGVNSGGTGVGEEKMFTTAEA